MKRLTNKEFNLESIPIRNWNLLKDLYQKLFKILSNKRPIMYSDIINVIIKEKLQGNYYTQLILWCNYNIRKGNYNVNIDEINAKITF